MNSPMNDRQTLHAMSLDDAYHVDDTLARGPYGVTELVSLDGAGPFVRKKIPTRLARRDVWAALASCTGGRLPRVEATYELPDCFVVVYDYVPGPTLEHYVSQHGPLTRRDAIRAIDQICEALDELHRHGIVHRDITPANVIVAADGAHLIDFGIARAAHERTGERDTTALGTYGFAAPEQYGFAPTDARSDIYALGRLLGYLLTGRYPDDRDYARLLADEQTDSRLRAVVEHACAFEPSARPQHVGELRDELFGRAPQRRLAAHGVLARPAAAALTLRDRIAGRIRALFDARRDRKRHERRVALIVAGVAVLVIVALIGLSAFFAAQEHGNTSGASDQSSNQLSGQSSGQSGATAPADGSDSGSGGDGDGGGTSNTGTDNGDAAPVTGNPLTITESGWSVDKIGYVHYAVAMRNTSDASRIEYPTARITGRDSNGAVIFTDECTLGLILPGQTAYCGGQTGQGVAPQTVEFTAAQPHDSFITASQDVVDLTVTGQNVVASQSNNSETFTGEVSVAAHGFTPDSTQSVHVTVVLRDKNGAIVYGENTHLDWPADSEPYPFSVTLYNPPDYDSYEAYASID